MSKKPLHSYILVRSDMPLAAQMAQSGHAAQEAAFLLGSAPEEPIHIIILSCASEAALIAAAERLASKGFDPHLFHEPDWPKGYTALYLKPQHRNAKLKAAMGSYPLWNASPPASGSIQAVIDAGEDPLNPKIHIQPESETVARMSHLLNKAAMELFDRLYFLRESLGPLADGNKDIEALDKLSELLDYGCSPGQWAQKCEEADSGYAQFREFLKEPHMGDCCGIACSCLRCHAEAQLGIDTAPKSKAIGHRLWSERMAKHRAQTTPSALPINP